MDMILFVKVTPIAPRPMGLVRVDIDADAERFVIINRLSGEILTNNLRPTTGISKTLVSLNYTTSNKLIVGILDDGLTYDCKFVDGVQAELVDANTVDMSQ